MAETRFSMAAGAHTSIGRSCGRQVLLKKKTADNRLDCHTHTNNPKNPFVPPPSRHKDKLRSRQYNVKFFVFSSSPLLLLLLRSSVKQERKKEKSDPNSIKRHPFVYVSTGIIVPTPCNFFVPSSWSALYPLIYV